MKKVVTITSVGKEEKERKFWLNKSFQARIDAIENLRLQLIEFKNADKRLQRVCKVTNRL